ncbi:hypothetical protein [Massilia glaciei]|uniref:Uncharacterized protein n=1 Tax=Massilia glaciei TaxID=1524097 RepID=A0A2U2HJL0_9BURK|nr:hypothetical protein [Massilia glaciei]PWF47673.1 hypothetical protein C7C56_014515 [Massilia glaciei]
MLYPVTKLGPAGRLRDVGVVDGVLCGAGVAPADARILSGLANRAVGAAVYHALMPTVLGF